MIPRPIVTAGVPAAIDRTSMARISKINTPPTKSPYKAARTAGTQPSTVRRLTGMRPSALVKSPAAAGAPKSPTGATVKAKTADLEKTAFLPLLLGLGGAAYGAYRGWQDNPYDKTSVRLAKTLGYGALGAMPLGLVGRGGALGLRALGGIGRGAIGRRAAIVGGNLPGRGFNRARMASLWSKLPFTSAKKWAAGTRGVSEAKKSIRAVTGQSSAIGRSQRAQSSIKGIQDAGLGAGHKDTLKAVAANPRAVAIQSGVTPGAPVRAPRTAPLGRADHAARAAADRAARAGRVSKEPIPISQINPAPRPPAGSKTGWKTTTTDTYHGMPFRKNRPVGTRHWLNPSRLLDPWRVRRDQRIIGAGIRNPGITQTRTVPGATGPAASKQVQISGLDPRSEMGKAQLFITGQLKNLDKAARSRGARVAAATAEGIPGTNWIPGIGHAGRGIRYVASKMSTLPAAARDRVRRWRLGQERMHLDRVLGAYQQNQSATSMLPWRRRMRQEIVGQRNALKGDLQRSAGVDSIRALPRAGGDGVLPRGATRARTSEKTTRLAEKYNQDFGKGGSGVRAATDVATTGLVGASAAGLNPLQMVQQAASQAAGQQAGQAAGGSFGRQMAVGVASSLPFMAMPYLMGGSRAAAAGQQAAQVAQPTSRVFL